MSAVAIQTLCKIRLSGGLSPLGHQLTGCEGSHQVSVDPVDVVSSNLVFDPGETYKSHIRGEQRIKKAGRALPA